jgi:hypothetical protein
VFWRSLSATPAIAEQIVGIGGKCLDVSDSAMTNGTRVNMWNCNAGTPNQRWSFGDR